MLWKVYESSWKAFINFILWEIIDELMRVQDCEFISLAKPQNSGAFEVSVKAFGIQVK